MPTIPLTAFPSPLTSLALRTERSGDVLLPNRSGSFREIPPKHALRNDFYPFARRCAAPSRYRVFEAATKAREIARGSLCQRIGFSLQLLPCEPSGARFLPAKCSALPHTEPPWAQAIPTTFSSGEIRRDAIPTKWPSSLQPLQARSLARIRSVARNFARYSSSFSTRRPAGSRGNNFRTSRRIESYAQTTPNLGSRCAPHFNQPFAAHFLQQT